MTNVPSIPPLLSSTPPPIDFGEEDNSGLPPTHNLVENDEFGDYALAADINDDDFSLPRTPLQHEIISSTSRFTEMPPGLDDHCSILTTNTNLIISSLPEKYAKPEVANIEHPAIPIETFNFDVGIKAMSTFPNSATMMLAVSVDSTKDLDETTIEEVGKDEANDEVELNFDCCNSSSLSSLKLDRLCLNNSGKQSPTSTPLSLSFASDDVEKFSDGDNELSTNAQANSIAYDSESDENKTKESTTKYASSKDCYVEKSYCSIVMMEDIVDDSSDDERHSPKKLKNLTVDENSEDFFAIHTVGNESNKNALHQNINLSHTHAANEDNDDASLKTTTENIIVDTLVTKSITESSKPLGDSKLEFDADFSQFQNFSSESHNIEEQQPAPDIYTIIEQPAIDVIEEDDFNDFQDFSPAPDKKILQNQTAVNPKMSVESANDSTAINFNTTDDNIYANDIDDDDFGDFAEASISTQVLTVNNATIPIQPSFFSGEAPISNSNQLLTLNRSNMNERLTPILNMMFPQIKECDNINKKHIAEQQESLSSRLQLGSIDSAKALGYQWINSEMRHSLIKSLGIDSRNILFGEKWNSSMPRFAANLSFNPLQPVKSQSASSGSSIFSAGGTHSSMHKVSINDTNAISQPPLATTSLAVSKADVPAVEFDWNSSGLVNPLDGSAKEDTANTGEVEAIYTSQSGESNASDAEPQQQQSFSIDSDSCNTGGGQNIDGSVDDTAATASGVSITTATTTLPTNVSTDGIGNQADLKSNIVETIGGNSNNNLTMTATIERAIPLTKEDTTFGISSNYSPAFSTTHITIDNDDDEVVTTSTYAGPLKETHIYTPPKGESAMGKIIRAGESSPVAAGGATGKTEPIDFDYKIAAAGIIIDETVVKKEYRDVEYNPRFGLEFCNRSNKSPDLLEETPPTAIVSTMNVVENADTLPDNTMAAYEDDFSDFQSVPLPTTVSSNAERSIAVPYAALPTTVTKTKDAISTANSRTCSPTIADKMILSPAILLPQAISLECNISGVKPKIEWGNSATSINPEELARIEQLFPQPKATVKSRDVAPQSASPTSTPTHNGGGGAGGHISYQPNSLSISATIAQKEQQSASGVNSLNDDDYWSDFVSVSVATTNISNSNSTIATPKLLNNNNLFQVGHRSPQNRQQQLLSPARKTNRVGEMSTGNNSNEDEWSDFVSSAPPITHAQATTAPQFRASTSSSHMPQFNSAAWQNANFYNNPMSFYHQSHTNVTPNNFIRNDNSGNSNNHNNNNNQYLNNYQQRLQEQQQQLQLQQQIHIMQDFSTAVPPQPFYRPNVSTHHSNQFPIGPAKISPSISLIPDLGFVAPAMPAHTAFINALPKSNFSTKK